MTLKQVFKKIIGEVNESNLVLNWANIRETKEGIWVRQDDPTACRYCIIGHYRRYEDKLSLKQKFLWNDILGNTQVKLYKPHTPAQVKRIFRTWLRKLENE